MDGGMTVSHEGQALLPVLSCPQEDMVSPCSMGRHNLPCPPPPASPQWGAVGPSGMAGDSPQLWRWEWDPVPWIGSNCSHRQKVPGGEGNVLLEGQISAEVELSPGHCMGSPAGKQLCVGLGVRCCCVGHPASTQKAAGRRLCSLGKVPGSVWGWEMLSPLRGLFTSRA